MIKQKYFRTAAFGALAAALAATPAFANEDESEQEVSLEARGTFAGFTGSFDVAASEMQRVEVSLDRPVLQRTSRGLVAQPVDPDPQIIVRDDVTLPGSVDVNNTVPYAVQMFLGDNTTGGVFYNCTGTLINPRTVLTAAHCVNSQSSEAYGVDADAAPLSILISTGVNTRPRLINTLRTGVGYADGGVATSTDVIIHHASNIDNGGLEFPFADVALIALDSPITDIPAAPILLSPLSELTHVIINGYGTFGTGDLGEQGIGLLRLVGENMLGAIASPADFVDQVFPGFAPTARFGFESQTMYFIDFDNPNRTPEQQAGCVFSLSGISCEGNDGTDGSVPFDTLDAIKAIDWFEGDAVDNEVGTAPGDSGSSIIVDELYDFPIVAGVLSGGYDFFGVENNFYGDVSFYNPLFPFFEFITENTPYKYVSALSGDGRWSDPGHWTQDLDPGFFIDDGTGNLVNGIPEDNELGVYATAPTIGTVLGRDIDGYQSGFTPYLFDENGYPIYIEVPESSALLGPGSTGFVPNNTDGTPGTAFANPAQYFDVLLLQPGTTSVDMDVTIDRLTIDGAATGFDLKPNKDFTSLISVEQYNGRSNIDGTLNTPIAYLIGGLMSGRGTINTNALLNVAGGLVVGDAENIRTLTINGDYVQTSGGALLVDVKPKGKGNPSDLLQVNGFASIAGLLGVSSLGNAKFDYGTRYTVLEANGIDGQFDAVQSFVNSPVIYFEQIVNADSVQVEVKAHSIARLVGANSSLASLGTTLDTLRTSGRYANYRGLFQAVDNAGFDQFGATLSGLTPVSGFAQSATATNFAMRFAGQLSQRTLALRGDGRAAAGFSSYGSASFAQAGTAPGEASKLGYFGSVSGSFLTQGRERNTGTKAFEEATFSQAGELTLGADYKLSDSVSFGMAVSSVRDGAATTAALQARPNQSTSVAGYGSASFGAGFADAYVGFADQRFGLSREAQGDLTEEFASAMGLADGKQSMAGIRAGYAFKPARGAMIGPVVSLDYVRSQLGGYREYGAGTFGLDVHDRTFTSLGAKVGAMGALDMKLGQKSKLTAFGSLAYARELGDSQDLVTASFVGADDLPFSIARQLDTDWVAVNAGASLEISDDFSTQLSLTSDFGRGELSSRQANVSLNWSF